MINNYEDVIDSRDVIERIEELCGEYIDLKAAFADAEDAYNAAVEDEADIEDFQTDMDEAALNITDWERDNLEELTNLENLQTEAEDSCEWADGATLVRDSYFTEYAIDTLKDCGMLPDDIPWYIEIDEDATASNIQGDYTSVDFDGVTYWVR